MNVLEINNLEVNYRTDEGAVQAVDGVSLTVKEGETVGIVGESGCGKSTFARSIIGTLPDEGHVEAGEIRFRGIDLTSLSPRERREYMWEEISFIPQSAMNGLDPVYTIRDQIIEAIETHRPTTSEAEANQTVEEMFEIVGLAPDRADDYPHQFSGGMRQRAMIAMALTLDPGLILADEPTTALDVIMQDQILKRIRETQRELDLSMIIITHDVSVVAETCDRVAVMYAGKLAEVGPVEDVFGSPYHPYTIGLTHAFPNIQDREQDLLSIPGHPPELVDPPSGCRFADRCPMATEKCRAEEPPAVQNGPLISYCHHADRIDSDFRDVSDSNDVWSGKENIKIN